MLEEQLRADLTSSMRARDTVRTATLRLALAAIGAEEVSGRQARTLSDDEVLAVLRREHRKRGEAAQAFEQGGRAELAARERSEAEILAAYLPAQLDDGELETMVRDALAAAGQPQQIGPAMKAAQQAVAGRAEGGRVAAAVRRLLG